MPGVEVVRVSVPDDVQGDVDIVAGPRPLTYMVMVSLVKIWPPVSILVSSKWS